MIEILKKTRDLVEQGWCQLKIAKNSVGIEVSVDDPSAVKWCIEGAIARACFERFPGQFGPRQLLLCSTYNYLGRQLLNTGVTRGLAKWNDANGRTKQQVLEFLDNAINRLTNDDRNQNSPTSP